jgi:endonuclease YncB( thermonuclease family)
MFGYDSAEMRSDQNVKATEAKQHLESLIQGQKLLDVEFFDYDKYGRPLVKLFVKDCCINDQMIKVGHGKPYYGQTKEKW